MSRNEPKPPLWVPPIIIDEKRRVDRLLLYVPDSSAWLTLEQWRQTTDTLHYFTPDFHRLQLEHWLWMRFTAGEFPTDRVLDIGVYSRRSWMGEGYRTVGFGDTDADFNENILDASGQWAAEPWDVIVCTEVLEHCAEPVRAVQNLHAALKPGGRLFASSPFLWPDHSRTPTAEDPTDYPDYWRFTEQGWKLLCAPFGSVEIIAAVWTNTGQMAYDILRQCEGWGFRRDVSGTTGFMVEAVK